MENGAFMAPASSRSKAGGPPAQLVGARWSRGRNLAVPAPLFGARPLQLRT